MLYSIRKRMQVCKRTLHETKTQVVNVRGSSERKYPKRYDFIGFEIDANLVKMHGKGCLVPSVFGCAKSISVILSKFKQLNIHKRRTTIELLAKELSPFAYV